MLAQGGTSVVWLARNKGIGGFEKLVAVKTIQPEHAGNAKYQRLLVEEARIAAEIQDPHVVQVLDLGLVGEVGYIVMELIDGESLRALLHTLAKKKQKLPIPIALRIAADVCSGLAAAHGLVREGGSPAGVVHRDVSPENVLVTSAGNACLIDFGFAVERDSESVRGGTVGKPQFLAPEVAEGEVADARSDLWSAGALLYYMLAGRVPYDGMRPLAALHALISHAPIPPLPDEVPEPVRAVVDQALQYHLDQRFARAVAMRKAIESASASSVGIAARGDVAAFVERVLAERIVGRRRAMERALQEAERREHVFASLMAPPEILPAGEQKTPWRQSEARQRAAESQAVPSSSPDVPSSRGEPETLMKTPKKLETLRPDPSDPFAMSVAPDTLREPAPTTKHISSIPKPPVEAPRKQPGTNPYGLRPPTVRRSSRPPMLAADDVNAPRARMPTIPPLAPPPSSSRFRASDLLASTVSSKPKITIADDSPETEPETVALPDRPPMAPPDPSPFKGKTERPPSGQMAAVKVAENPQESPFKGKTERPPSGPRPGPLPAASPAANAIGPVISGPTSAVPSSSMSKTVPLAPPLVHPMAAAMKVAPFTDPPPPLVTPPPTPPPPLVLSAPPPPLVQSAPPPQLELPSFQKPAPSLVLADSLNPPPPMLPVAASLDPPPLEAKRTPIFVFAGGGALILVAAAVAILVLRRGSPAGTGIINPADSSDGNKTASASSSPSSSPSNVPAVDSASNSNSFGSSGIAGNVSSIPSSAPPSDPSGHVAAAGSGTKGGKKGLHGGHGAHGASSATSHTPQTTNAPPDPPAAPPPPVTTEKPPPPPSNSKKGEDYGF